MELRTDTAVVNTASVEIRIITVKGKQVTQAMYNQIVEEDLIDWSKLQLLGDVWGWVNHCPRYCRGWGRVHRHFIWSNNGTLRRWAGGDDDVDYEFNKAKKRAWRALIGLGWGAICAHKESEEPDRESPTRYLVSDDGKHLTLEVRTVGRRITVPAVDHPDTDGSSVRNPSACMAREARRKVRRELGLSDKGTDEELMAIFDSTMAWINEVEPKLWSIKRPLIDAPQLFIAV